MGELVEMFLGGSKYVAEDVLKICKAGINVTINIAEINDDSNKDHIVTFSSEFTDDDAPITFYKQHGKYTVIAGKKAFSKALADPKFKGEVKGRLVTSVALKRAKIVEQVEEEVKSYPREFSNRPRFSRAA